MSFFSPPKMDKPLIQPVRVEPLKKRPKVRNRKSLATQELLEPIIREEKLGT